MANNYIQFPMKGLRTVGSKQWAKRERKEEEERPSSRSIKQAFVQLHVTSDDLAIARSNVALKPAAHRHTWPAALKEKKPGFYEFDEPPTLVRTPWEYERNRRPPSQKSRNSSDLKPLPPQMFEQIPREILICILDQLKVVHAGESTLNAKFLQNDLHSLCLSNKRWHRVVRERLYREVLAPSNDDARQKKNVSFRRSLGRLQLLSRTLSESPALAEMVGHIHVTAALASQLENEVICGGSGQRKSTTLNVLSDVISMCRNLEHFSGFTPLALEPAAELLASLSGCAKLKSHIWRLPSEKIDQSFALKAGDFMNCYTRWPQLQTLVFWQSPDGCSIPPGTVSGVVQRLPSLKHLCVRGLHPSEFHNGTLLMLPGLKSLRLEELHGITDQGLEQLALSRLAFSLERFTLCGLELTSLRTIQTLFANLSRLRHFTLQQNTSPELQQIVAATSATFSLRSSSLQNLHWDVIAPGHATTILANSIASGKFPQLMKVKVPSDYDGAIQNLCRPLRNEPLDDNDLRTLEESESSSHYHRSLRVSQIQAQLRIRETRKQPAFNVVVQDEDNGIEHKHFIGSYLGSMASSIEYSLDPAIGGSGVALAPIDTVALPHKSGLQQRMDGTAEQMLELDMLF